MQATRVCSVPECDRPHKGRGLCDMHLQRLRRTGTTDSPVRSLADRFWEKVDKRGPNECWEWQGARRVSGYGAIYPGESGRSGPSLKAHRVSLQLAGVDIDGLVVRHRCDNPPCVNPAHLEIGEQVENVADMVGRGRHSHGTSRPRARLTEAEVTEIRRRVANGEYHRVIAADYRISRSRVTMIANGKAWRHVTPPAARDLVAAVAEALA